MKVNVFDHMKTDPNAGKHATLGFVGCVLCLAVIVGLNSVGIFLPGGIWINIALLFGSGFVAGIVIELVQRVQRIGKQQNTINESLLDIAVTGLWWLYIPKR